MYFHDEHEEVIGITQYDIDLFCHYLDEKNGMYDLFGQVINVLQEVIENWYEDGFTKEEIESKVFDFVLKINEVK